MLSQLLCACHHSLRTLTMTTHYPRISQLSLVPMKTLSKLKIVSLWSLTSSSGVDFYLDSVLAIEYETLMPYLEEIELLKSPNSFESDFWVRFFRNIPRNELRVGSNRDHATIPCTTGSNARRLHLHLSRSKTDLSPLKRLTPNILSFQLSISDDYRDTELPRFPQIWELWPKLEQVNVRWRYVHLDRYYDADFCGIHEEEAKYLRQKGDKFLRSVHIVPIKPCLATMSSESSFES